MTDIAANPPRIGKAAPLPQFVIEWIDGKREPQMPASEEYPNGIDVIFAPPHVDSCKVPLPYPAARCGFYAVTCNQCGSTVCLTTVGRRDDPRSVTIACKRKPEGTCHDNRKKRRCR